MGRSPLLDLAYGFMPAQVLYAAAETGVADALAAGPRTGEDLAKETGTHAPSLRRLLRALASLGVVEQRDTDLFELTPLGAGLKSDDPGSVRGLVRLFCGPEVWNSWGDLVGTLRSGEPAWERVTGMTSFEFMAANEELAGTFNTAMAQHTRAVAPAVVENGDFGRFRTIADLGGGDGTLLAAILGAVPDASGILFDLPAGHAGAERTLNEAGVADRCRVVSGDFFESVPEGADAYVLKSVVHDWDDEKAAAILRRCREAMRPDARVLLVEFVMPEVVTPEDSGNVMSDINMLVVLRGRERTERDFRDLLGAAGFGLTAITGPLPPSGYRVIEAAPA
ncbi:methyltransferase [Actinomadura rugatobispora]|uniref:Methyltransferase n=1 Tax=Actinomadura rugatobispora TaxID=1994 RepID=A0ABW1AHB3_9ACTN|nr:methyltransferase [Actinomadura rugatobispora]